MRHTRSVLLASALAIAPMADVLAQQQYPTRRVRVIAPVPVEASANAAARIVAAALAEILGQSFIVENHPGALGLLGARELLKAKPDGYTICFCNDGTVITVPAAYHAADKQPPYSPLDNFTPIGQAVTIYYMLVARSDFPATNFKEVVEYARANPQTVRIASASPMGTIVTGLFKELVGQDVAIDVPYKGAKGEGTAFNDLMGGHIDLLPATSFNALPLAAAGKVKIIGAVGWQRNPYLKNVQTLAEQAPEFEQFNMLTGQLMPWNGLVGPKGMPTEVVAILSEALQKALQDPGVVAALATAKLGVRYGDQKTLEDLFKRLPIVTEILKHAGVKFVE